MIVAGHLLLDAWLFQLMARYPDEVAGGRAVDERLVRMRLRRPAGTVRTLSQRLAGTRSIIVRHHAVLAAFLAVVAAAFLRDP